MLQTLTCLISVNPRELSAYLRMECNFSTCFVELVLPLDPGYEVTPGVFTFYLYCVCVQDAGTPNMSELVSAVASKMTSAVLGKLSKAG